MPSDTSAAIDTVMHLAQLEMEVKNLREKLKLVDQDRLQKTNECLTLAQQMSDKSEAAQALETRLKRAEKSLKENEIQIRLLGELREKDAKQHLKSLSELDTQLKKKTTESEKVSHLLEQLRIKQERIQELDAQLNRIEKQSNQERQTFEKQVHDNWLASKRIDKQLRDAQAEVESLQKR